MVTNSYSLENYHKPQRQQIRSDKSVGGASEWNSWNMKLIVSISGLDLVCLYGRQLSCSNDSCLTDDFEHDNVTIGKVCLSQYQSDCSHLSRIC